MKNGDILIYGGSGSDESSSSFGTVFPLVGKAGGSAVVAGQSVNSGLDENQSVLGVLILAAFLEVASDVDCLLDHAVDVFGELRGASWIKERVPFFLRRRTIF